MSESSLSVIDYDYEEVAEFKFLESHLVDEKHKKESSVKKFQTSSPLNYITSLSSSITNAWSIFLSNPQFQNDFETFIKDENITASHGMSYFLAALIKDVGYSHMNQYIKLCLLTIQIDLLDPNDFVFMDSADQIYVASLSTLLDSDDKDFLYDCYLNLVPIVLKPFLDAFPFKEFLTYSKEITPSFTTFSSLETELRSYKQNKKLLDILIVSDLKKLTIDDCTLTNMEVCNVLNKVVDRNGSIAKVYWGHSDTVNSDLKIFSDKLSDNFLSEIKENRLAKHIRSVNSNLLYLPPSFSNVNQQERLSMKYLSYLAKSLDKPSDDENIRIFCHRNVLTNIIVAIHDKNSKGINFRVYRTKYGIFIQPIEEPRRSDDFKTNPAVKAGYGFERFLAEEDQNENSYTYLMNKFTLGNKDFYVQSEIDSCSPDCETFYELKTISQNGFSTADQRAAKCLRTWAQNFFLPNNRVALLGLRSKSFDLTSVIHFSQSELINEWNHYYAEDRAHLRSQAEITEYTLESLSHVFDHIKVSALLHPLKNDNCIYLRHSNVKYRSSDKSVYTSCYFAHEYDLTAKQDIARGDIFVRQGLDALYNTDDIVIT